MTQERGNLVNWALFAALSFIWGSSFILMKEGLNALSPYQVAALRMLSAGVVMLPAAIRSFKKIPFRQTPYLILSGLIGNFIPAFLFCLAETRIDSSLAGFLNALTPIFIIIIGALYFKNPIEWKKASGILISFVGMILLFLAKSSDLQYLSYATLVILATIFYAINVNLVNHRFKDIRSINIVTVSFVWLIIPSLLVLLFSGYFNLPFENKAVLWSTGAGCILGILGTAFATILFYALLKRAGPVFAGTVPYGIPFIALLWGLLANESITVMQVVGLCVILLGVYLANQKKKVVSNKC